MKKLILTGILALVLMSVPTILIGQTNASVKPAEVKPTDSTSCGNINYGGQIYRTVIIGSQCWMKDNLNIGKWIDESQVQKQTDNNLLEKYCYGNNFVNCDQWGGLYQWDEMMQYVQTPNAQGICPPGWHIPSSQDWKTVIRFLGGDNLAGGKMKYTGSNGWQTPNVGATNSSGFTALPGGYFDYMPQQWHDIFRDGYFWSSETISKSTAVAMTLNYRNDMTDLYEEYMLSALSVRCVRNE
ncbi:MAG: FISUMP domain-containing protein [Bacteroidales bacterium]|nr:FISUMP domain-containing protein [Bacteroidales bacterium]